MKTQSSYSDINTSRILRLIWQRKLISRVEIASVLGLDKSTVTKIVNELKELGLLRETIQGKTGPLGGRPPVFLEITPEFACVGGIEITPGRVVCCLLNLHGDIIFEDRQSITTDEFLKMHIKGVFSKACHTIQKRADELGIKLVGIGLGLPGLLNSSRGEIEYSLPLMIQTPFSLKEQLEEVTDIPVEIENDARCCCYSEMISSQSTAVNNMIFVLTEYRAYKPAENSKKNLAVGFGIVLDSELLKGRDETAGEFRSMLWEEGTVGQFHSGDGNLSEKLEENSEMRSVFMELARHIAFLVNTLNLQTVCIGGMEPKYIKVLQKYVHERIEIQWSYTNERQIDVRMSTYDDLAVAHGAGSMYLTKIFSIPEAKPEKVPVSAHLLNL
ncbi:MAG: ROK family transcriptional regulator [Treponema sp.]|nr:ROK family transcriptional regulator [Treponema sp.]